MNKTLLDFPLIKDFPKLTLDYLNQESFLKSFYNFPPHLDSFKKLIEERKENTDRELLIKVIKEQYHNCNLFSSYQKVSDNINLLKEKTTFTVTTGHQLNIFTGPLYFIYKIISTINLAEELKKTYPTYNFIPVYWMASEDHDFEEINHINLFDRKISWKHKQEGAVGRFSTLSLATTLEDIKDLMGNSEDAQKLYKLFSNAYLKNNSLTQATKDLVNSLFGEYGLVVVDGDDKSLKASFKKIINDDILNNKAYQLVNETIKALDKHYKAQVHPREVNLFYLGDNFRERIVKTKDAKYEVLNTTIIFTQAELLKEIENFPEKFSPNVVLRPLYQEKVLPNLAYIGGPAEVAYWLEYKKMFEYYQIDFPVLMLRNSVLWIDPLVSKKLDKLNIAWEDIFLETDVLIKQHIEKLKEANHKANIESEAGEIGLLLSKISNKASQVDITLKASAEGEASKIKKSLKHIENKITKAYKQKNETSVSRIRSIKEKLFPDNVLQERYDNFIPYYLKYGDDFFKIIKENINSFEKKIIVLQE